MALTPRQIERYSRQLIVPAFGGVAQQRLLAARVALVIGEADAGVIAYLVGAGVGRIDLHADLDAAACESMVARMRDLNPDCTVRVVPRIDAGADSTAEATAEYDLALMIVGDAATLTEARALCDRPLDSGPILRPAGGVVLARLDRPARIAVIAHSPPCPRCADAGDLISAFDQRDEYAGFVASLAALEAIKLLAHIARAPGPTLIEFDGYAASAQPLASPRSIDSSEGASCACARARAAI